MAGPFGTKHTNAARAGKRQGNAAPEKARSSAPAAGPGPLRVLAGRAGNDLWLKGIFPAVYRMAAIKPVKPGKVVLIELRYDKVMNSLELIRDRLAADPKIDLHVHCMNNSAKSKLRHYRECISLVRDLADAQCIFISEGSEVLGGLPMRPQTRYVQVWHACGAFKKFGMSTAQLLFGASAQEQKRHPVYGNVTHVTVSAPEVVWAYAEAMDLPKERICPTGVSRTDVFFSDDRIHEAKERLRKAFPQIGDRKVLLYAPTFRGHTNTAEAPDALDYHVMQEALGSRFALVIKHHALVRKTPELPKDLKGQFVFDATGVLPIEDLLMASDMCISDYSSLIFEYSLFERPMLFFAYDLDEYNDWRGFYYPYEEMTPGPVCRTNEELISKILEMDCSFDPKEVHAFRERFMGACDGHATDRILQMSLGRSIPAVRINQ